MGQCEQREPGTVTVAVSPGRGSDPEGRYSPRLDASSRCETVSSVAEAAKTVNAEGEPLGLGTDAPMWWSACEGAGRSADARLRARYGIPSGTVQSGNSLRGAALVGGALLASRLWEAFTGIRCSSASSARWTGRRLWPDGTIGKVRPLSLRHVVHYTREIKGCNEFIARCHHFGYKTLVGVQMRYVVYDRDGWPLAMLGFSNVARRLAPRDRFIGWTPQLREKNLPSSSTTRGSSSCSGSRSPTWARAFSPSCAGDCPRTGPSAETSRRCSSRPSSRPHASPERSTRRRAGRSSEPPRGAAATTGVPDATSRRRTSGSGSCARTGDVLSTGDIMVLGHSVWLFITR